MDLLLPKWSIANHDSLDTHTLNLSNTTMQKDMQTPNNYTTDVTFREVAQESNVLAEADLLALQARNDKSLISAFNGRGRKSRMHQAKLTQILYRGKEEELELVMTSRIKARREMLLHWLKQGGLFLRRETAAMALKEFEKLEDEIIAHMRQCYKQAKELKEEADTYSEVPSIKKRMDTMIERLLDESEEVVESLVRNFKQILHEKV